MIAKQEKMITVKVQDISAMAVGYVTDAEIALVKALTPIKPELEKATQLESALQKINPDIDIPDPTDLEEAFDVYTDKIVGLFFSANEALDRELAKAKALMIPRPLRSRADFDWSVFYPIMVLFLMGQLFFVWLSQPAPAPVIMPVMATNDMVNMSTEDAEAAAAKISEQMQQAQAVYEKYMPLFVALQTYLTSALQISFMYYITRAQAIATQINMFLKACEAVINSVLDKYIAETFEAIFQKGFEKIKSKFLDFLIKWAKTAAVMMKAQAMIFGKDKAQEMKKQALGEVQKQTEEAQRKAREAAEEAQRKKKQAEKGLAAAKNFKKGFGF